MNYYKAYNELWNTWLELDQAQAEVRNELEALYHFALSEGVDFTKQKLTKVQQLRYGQPEKTLARYLHYTKEKRIINELMDNMDQQRYRQ